MLGRKKWARFYTIYHPASHPEIHRFFSNPTEYLVSAESLIFMHIVILESMYVCNSQGICLSI